MDTSVRKHGNFAGFCCVVVLSSATMLWLFWHHPVKTGIATLIVLSLLGLSARLAQWVDADGLAERRRGNQGA